MRVGVASVDTKRSLTRLALDRRLRPTTAVDCRGAGKILSDEHGFM